MFLLSILMIVVPVVLSAWYLWTRAIDQYESRVGFAIRTEEVQSPFEMLGALGLSSSSAAKDGDILYEFVQSQQLVADLDRKLDLRAMFSRPSKDPLWDGDPLMTLAPGGTIEDLVDFWKRMVLIRYDGSTGLIELRVYAFNPQDAQDIANAVLLESGAMINQLSDVARADATRYSKDALDQAEARLSETRRELTEFRILNQIVDPSADIASQMGLLNTLNTQLATALIESDLLAASASANDPRIDIATRRIEVIQQRITEERRKMGVGDGGDMSGFAALFAEYERLLVNMEFAEKSYLSALAGYDAAVSEAQRNSRYLSAFVKPTFAEAATAPNRPLLLALIAALGFFGWAIVTLIYYALRDRR